MNLTPREKDKLLVSVAAMVARRRLERGGRSVAELMADGATFIKREQVMEGVAEMIHDIQVEATFPDGTKLVTVHEPVR